MQQSVIQLSPSQIVFKAANKLIKYASRVGGYAFGGYVRNTLIPYFNGYKCTEKNATSFYYNDEHNVRELACFTYDINNTSLWNHWNSINIWFANEASVDAFIIYSQHYTSTLWLFSKANFAITTDADVDQYHPPQLYIPYIAYIDAHNTYLRINIYVNPIFPDYDYDVSGMACQIFSHTLVTSYYSKNPLTNNMVLNNQCIDAMLTKILQKKCNLTNHYYNTMVSLSNNDKASYIKYNLIRRYIGAGWHVTFPDGKMYDRATITTIGGPLFENVGAVLIHPSNLAITYSKI